MRIYRHISSHEFHSALGDPRESESSADAESEGRTRHATFVEPDPTTYEAIEVEGITAKEFTQDILAPAERKAGGGFRRVLIEDGNPSDEPRPDELGRLPTGHHLRAKPGS